MSKKVVPIGALSGQMHLADEFVQDVLREYLKARAKFGPFDNGHEGLAVIWEEFEELKSFVFGKNQTQEQIENARTECIQLAAMAMAFYLELLT